MKFRPTTCNRSGVKAWRARPQGQGLVRGGARGSMSRGGFTLVEVLAALVFMAILIPVTMRAVQLANKVGQVGERKAVAARVAERVLNELLVTGGVQQTFQKGIVSEGERSYEWNMRSEPWSQDAMNLITVTVVYAVQGQDYEVSLSTLFDNATLTQ